MTGPWRLRACRKLPPCCPRPTDYSSPHSSHCDRCRWATGPPAPPSRLKDKEIDAHRLPAQSVTCTLVETNKRTGFDFWTGAVAKNSSGLMHVQQMSHGIIWIQQPGGWCSLRSAYARLSLPCCGNKNNCLLGFHSPQRGSVCDHVMSISTLKLAPLPSQFNISRRAAKGRGHVQRDLFDLLQWFFICQCLWDHRGAYFPSDCVTSIPLFVRACLCLIW